MQLVWQAFLLHTSASASARASQVNISHNIRKAVKNRVEEPDPEGTLFQEAYNHIMGLMSRDTYRRFLSSPAFESIRAQVAEERKKEESTAC